MVETGPDAPGPAAPLALPIDPTLTPIQASLPDAEGNPRPVARMKGAGGVAMDFVLGELIIGTDDTAALAALVARWGGTVLASTEKVGDQPRQHRVRLDPSDAQVANLLADVQAEAPDLTGTFTSSSEAAAKLLAVALSEANRGGLTASPNFVLPSDAIADGTTAEAPTGEDGLYGPDAFLWPYMDRGSAQDIGVGAAWQALSRAGRLSNRVRIMIMDGGFAPSDDFPASRTVIGSWNIPNPASCSGGGACPWHGTMVTTAAMGVPDNAFGAAGPAGPVAELLAVPSEGDFFGTLSTVGRVIASTAFGNPRILNMSFGFELDLGWDIAVKAACLGLCPSPSEIMNGISTAVAASGKLLFASAGNAGKDVDNGGDIVEGSMFIPCELVGVICVGGMGHDTTTRDAGSNFGSRVQDASVDIYGPFLTWVGPDPDNPANFARLKAGTSFSSPFVAGVAALVWAADPSLTAGQVWGILRDTANTGGLGVTGNQRRVNAFAAVARVLGGSPPSVSLTGSATGALNREVFFTAVVTDPEFSASGPCPPGACPLTWVPAPTRIVGNTAYYRFDTTGNRTITVTAEDAIGQSTDASREVNIVNAAPSVSISQPAADASVAQGIAIQLLGTATDLNEGPDPGPGPIACTWTSSNAADAAFPKTGCNTTASFASTGNRTLTLSAVDPQGLPASASVAVIVTAPPTNLPPNITLGSVPAPNYSGGYAWDVAIAVTASATDPEGNNPITYVWKATSYQPNSTAVYASAVVVSGPGSTAGLNWNPSATPSLLGDFGALGNACYDGQIVRLTLEASDSLGNRSIKSLADIKVFRCILG
jgi:hypothetical protein